VWRDEWEESEEVMQEDESAQFLRAQRVIAHSKQVVRAQVRPQDGTLERRKTLRFPEDGLKES
jgi:hypothetical protein